VASLRKGRHTFFRLSPVERAEALCFGVTRGELVGRVDVNFWRLTPLLREKFSRPLYPVSALGAVVELMQYGCSSLATEDPIGVPIVRMNNLQNDGWDFRDLKYIDLGNEELARYRLEVGDLLFNRTNSKELVGKCDIFTEPGDWVFASYLIRVRLNSTKVLPQFASDFLGTRAGRLQIDRVSRQIIGMTNINAEELKEILLPVPPDTSKQRELVAAMDAARAERQGKLAEAEALLVGLDTLLLKSAGLTEPERPKSIFGVKAGDLVGMLNPDRYRAMQLERHLPFRTHVGDVGDLLDARCTPEKESPKELWDWIRIDDLPNYPWQVESVRTELGENISGSFFEVKENDILIARLGPTILNAKFVLCPKLARRTVASSEFLVLRCSSNWQPVAALWMLRTKLYRDIMYLRSRGGTPSRFRLDGDDLASIPFPSLDKDIQTALTTEIERCHRASRRLRAEAEAGWQTAKRWFEEQLLGASQQ
jgi:type I restriction enzyme S subunit